MAYLALFLSLPTRASSGRMRVWRSLKALGAAALRDGVYLLPDDEAQAMALAEVAAAATAVQGSADVYRLAASDDAQGEALQALFDRSADYAALADALRALHDELGSLDGPAATRRLQSLARGFAQVARTDFFPAEAQRQTAALLDDVRAAVGRLVAPDEPTPSEVAIRRLDPAAYRGRTWATRAHPWVDRLASVWLIRRHIDPEARIAWLASPADCRADWLGFDFDGAAFSHVGARVSFETLLASFGLDDDPALVRLGALVHFLDIGGLPVADASGVEALLTGARATCSDDDTLLAEASKLFDWLSLTYREKSDA